MTTSTGTTRRTPHSALQKSALLVLRMTIAWHVLYEGLTKWQAGDWSAAMYLRGADGPGAGFFHWIAATPAALTACNLVTIYGLIALGALLMLGIGTRVASLAAGLLIGTFYVAGFSTVAWSAEGPYLFVNKTLIETIALFALAMFPSSAHIGLGHALAAIVGRMRPARAAVTDAPVSDDRRAWLTGLITIPCAGGFAYAFANDPRRNAPDGMSGATIQLKELSIDELAGTLPKGKIGDLEMTRLILGCNLIGGWAHSRDLIYVPSLFKAYNTREKIFETLWLAEQAGIDSMNVVTAQFDFVNEYKRVTGGKIKTMTQVIGDATKLREEIDRAIDAGTTTLYLQGAVGDRCVRDGQIDLLADGLEYMKQQGYVAGIGGHAISTIKACEDAGLNPDYYVKTCHHDQYWSAHPQENRVEFSVDGQSSNDHNQFHDNIFDLFPEQTVEIMQNVKKPWIGFKVLAGGALMPQDGFKYAFQNGCDFICVGMFDFQIVADTNIAIEALAATQTRSRAWLG